MRKRILVVAGGSVALLAHAGVVYALLHGGSVLGALALGGGLGFLSRRPALVGVFLTAVFLDIFGYSQQDGLDEWAKYNRAGFVLAPDTRFAEAIAEAESRHGLRSAPDAPLLAWRSPEEKRSEGWRRVLYAVLATQGVWLLGALSWIRARTS